MSKQCSVNNCDSKCVARGFCNKHYIRMKKYGDLELRAKRFDTDRNTLPEDKFWARINKTNKCWQWLGATMNEYGIIWVNSKRWYAHRYSYWLHNGSVDKDLVIDHLCCNKGCVNPKHLELVTTAENFRRGKERAGML